MQPAGGGGLGNPRAGLGETGGKWVTRCRGGWWSPQRDTPGTERGAWPTSLRHKAPRGSWLREGGFVPVVRETRSCRGREGGREPLIF